MTRRVQAFEVPLPELVRDLIVAILEFIAQVYSLNSAMDSGFGVNSGSNDVIAGLLFASLLFCFESACDARDYGAFEKGASTLLKAVYLCSLLAALVMFILFICQALKLLSGGIWPAVGVACAWVTMVMAALMPLYLMVVLIKSLFPGES